MKRQAILSGCLLVISAIGCWVRWLLMPDPGTTDTAHIAAIAGKAFSITIPYLTLATGAICNRTGINRF